MPRKASQRFVSSVEVDRAPPCSGDEEFRPHHSHAGRGLVAIARLLGKQLADDLFAMANKPALDTRTHPESTGGTLAADPIPKEDRR